MLLVAVAYMLPFFPCPSPWGARFFCLTQHYNKGMEYTISNQFGAALLNSLGLPVQDVEGIDLHCHTNELITATITVRLQADKIENIMQQLRNEHGIHIPDKR